MSLENDDHRSPNRASEKFEVVHTKPKIMYPRELLLSLSNLDICKKLPRGFDESLLSEFEDTSQSIPDRPRIPSSLPLQGFRRNEYGSSPPTRGDSSNYSGGNYGRWESRSSGRSDGDSDSQSDMNSDFGRRYGTQSRRSWQAPEHDGLLGSGSFPRPSGSAAGLSAPKARVNENYQSKSSDLYHPPRPYKAIPHLRRDTDAYNDETFGSMECTSEDRAEEERRRRASFETMRKEQQKSLLDKQKVNLEKHKAGSVSDLSEVLEDSKKDKVHFVNNKMEASTATPILSNDLEKSSFASHSPASRPLVPPGFKNNILDKSFGLKPLIHPFLSEVGKHVTGESPLHAGDSHIQNGTADDLEQQLSQDIGSLVDRQPADKTKHEQLLNKGESANLDLSFDIPTAKPGVEDQFPHISSHMDSHGTRVDPETVELNAEVLENKSVSDSKGNHSTSILENFFGSKLSMSGGACGLAEHHESKLDDTWSPNYVQSSKFARWFSEEEAKPADENLSGRPKDLLSFLVSDAKGRNQGSIVEVAGHFPCDFSSRTLENSNKLTLDVPSAANGLSEQVCPGDKKEVVSTVLTCEDLEQLMLSEYSSKTSNVHPLLKTWSTTGANIEKPSMHVDDRASQHLLSLLQKGMDQSDNTLNSGVDITEDRLFVPQEADTADAVVNGCKGKDDTNSIPSSGKTLTLENLFGTAFMMELQSVDAPVSIQRGSVGSARVNVPEPHELSFPVTDKVELQRPNHDTSVLNSNHIQQTKPSLSENWLGFDNSQIERISSNHHSEAFPKHGAFDGVPEFQLPEEGNLISWTGNSSKNENCSSNAPIDVKEKLAAIRALVKDEHVMVDSDNLPFTRDPFEQMEPEFPYHNLQVQQSSPQFQSSQMTQGRPLFHPLNSHPAHMSSPTKFLGPEAVFNHDSRINLQFPTHMIRFPFHQPNVRVAGFDVPSHHSMLRQIQTSGNQPSRMLPDFPRGGPDSYRGNQIPRFIQEMNPIPGFPFGPTQANIASHGVQLPAPVINSGGNPPEAFQRLIEMELRANSKQIHPFAPGHHQGVYNHEVDMGFQY